MKIALIGYGGMGKVVARIALERGHEVAVIVYPGAPMARKISGESVQMTWEGREAEKSSPGTTPWNENGLFEAENAGLPAPRRPSESATVFVPKLSADVLKNIDVVIDFSRAEAVMENVSICKEAGVNLVMGTTGWYGKMEGVREMIAGNANDGGKKENQSMIGFFWSSNFSIGINLYFKIVEAAAKMINNFDEYDVWGHEIHHCNKADSPSGTAKTLEKILLSNISRKTAVVEDKLDRRRAENEIHFSSVRGGLVNFGHTIGFDSVADRILITHEARCRDGYALGAVKAAEWLNGKKGFFGMEDFLAL